VNKRTKIKELQKDLQDLRLKIVEVSQLLSQIEDKISLVKEISDRSTYIFLKRIESDLLLLYHESIDKKVYKKAGNLLQVTLDLQRYYTNHITRSPLHHSLDIIKKEIENQ
jgi:hypothetical protein